MLDDAVSFIYRMTVMKEALSRAVAAAGGPVALSRKIGITPQAISQWEKAPPERCIAIEQAIGGAVTRYELRPDIFGDPPDTPLATPGGEQRPGEPTQGVDSDSRTVGAGDAVGRRRLHRGAPAAVKPAGEAA